MTDQDRVKLTETLNHYNTKKDRIYWQSPSPNGVIYYGQEIGGAPCNGQYVSDVEAATRARQMILDTKTKTIDNPLEWIDSLDQETKPMTKLEILVREIMLDAQEYTKSKANRCNVEYQAGRIVDLMADEKDKHIAAIEEENVAAANLIANLSRKVETLEKQIECLGANVITLGQENADLANRLIRRDYHSPN